MKTVSKKCRKFSFISFFTLVLLTANGFSQNPDPNFFIFLAFGQSNMEGFWNQMQPQDTVGISPRFQLLPAVDWPDGSRKKGTWTKAVPTLCRSNIPKALCPCDYFGRTLIDSLPANVKIGIINVAVAGCKIEMFDKDKYQTYINSTPQGDMERTFATYYDGNPYARLVEMGKLAQKDGVIKGFLLHQGESGTMSGNTWTNEVKKIYFDLIKDLSLDSTKTPILPGDLASSNSEILEFPQHLKYAHVIPSRGIQVGSAPHFSAQGYRDFGKRYADTMLNVFKILHTGPTAIADNNTKVGHAAGSGFELTTTSSSISFQIPLRAFVSLSAYTLSGKEIASLAAAEYAAGKHSIAFGAKTIPSGVVVFKMKAGAYSTSRTVLVQGQ